MMAFGLNLAEPATKELAVSFWHGLPYLLLVVLVGALSYYQQRQMSARMKDHVNPQQQMIMKVLPIGFAVFALILPAGLIIYFLTSSLYRIAQQAYITRQVLPQEAAEEADAGGRTRRNRRQARRWPRASPPPKPGAGGRPERCDPAAAVQGRGAAPPKARSPGRRDRRPSARANDVQGAAHGADNGPSATTVAAPRPTPRPRTPIPAHPQEEVAEQRSRWSGSKRPDAPSTRPRTWPSIGSASMRPTPSSRSWRNRDPGLFGRVRGEARVRARVRPTQPRAKVERRDRRAGATASKDVAGGRSRRHRCKRARRTTMSDEPAPERRVATRLRRGPPRGRRRRDSRCRGVGRSCSGLAGRVRHWQADAERGRPSDGDVEVRLEGDDLGLLIGPRGQTLQAIQDVTRVAGQRHDEDHHGRLRIDIGGYRERRREALGRFTEQVAGEVKATRQAKVLEPMSSADRKVVHDALTGSTAWPPTPKAMSRSDGSSSCRRMPEAPSRRGRRAAGACWRRCAMPASRQGAAGSAAIAHARALRRRPPADGRDRSSTSGAAAGCPASSSPCAVPSSSSCSSTPPSGRTDVLRRAVARLGWPAGWRSSPASEVLGRRAAWRGGQRRRGGSGASVRPRGSRVRGAAPAASVGRWW